MAGTKTSSVPGLQPRIFWGLNTKIQGNIQYVTDHDVLYPVGGALIIHNFVQKTQSYIKLPEPQKKLNKIIISPNLKIVAVAEEGEKPCISLYDVKSLKRRKVLGLPYESAAKEFVSIAFTCDSRNLIAVTGEPDMMFLCYNWEKGKVESHTKANVPPGIMGPVTQVATSPTDPTIVVLVGPGLFRMMSLTDTQWRQYGFQKAEKMMLKCVCWMTSDIVLAGTRDGQLIIIEYGDLKGKYRANEVTEIDLQLTDESGQVVQVQSSSSITSSVRLGIDPDKEVTCVHAFTNCFLYSVGDTIFVFEKETKHRYKRRIIYHIPSSEVKDELGIEMNTVLNVAVNPSRDTLLATTLYSQIYLALLRPADVLSLQQPVAMTICGEALHHGPITGLSVCAWKTIFMTSGQIDKTVCVWDYTTESLLLSKHYHEQVFCVDLHPTGLYAVIGFSDKLRYTLVLLDDLSTIREFAIRTCKVACFSTSGHRFAAVNTSVIQVYCCTTFRCIFNLKGHSDEITSLVWTSDDRKLFSCGTDGALYEWEMYNGQRVGDVITKECKYTDIASTYDGKMVYGIGTDGLLKEICNAEILREEKLMHQNLHTIVLSRSNQMMFITGNRGAIVSVKYPLPRPPEFLDFYLHNNPVTQMKLTYDDMTLITSSDDGTLCIWKLVDTERKCVKMDPEFSYSKEILINEDDLAEKMAMIKYLENFVKSLEADHEYQMKEKETEEAERVNELHTSYLAAIQDLKEKNQELIAEHTAEINKMKSSVAEMKREHTHAMEKLESDYNTKLIVEYDKYEELMDRSANLREKLLKEISALEESKKKALQQMSEEYETKLKGKDDFITQLQDKAQQQVEEHEEIKCQLEEDADQELVDVRAQYEMLLKEERDTNIRLRGESGVMKKKFLTSQKEIDDLKHQVVILQGEHYQLKSVISGLEQDIVNLKKEIVERDTTIQENESRFSEIKNKNSELEKYKFVLTHKISELQMQIHPKEVEIRERKEQIQDMEDEIEERQKEIANLKLYCETLEEKNCVLDRENQKEHRVNRMNQLLLKRIQIDLHNASTLIQHPNELKKSVVALFHRYCESKELEHGRKEDRDGHAEFMRQRDHLERTVASLKNLYFKKISKPVSTDKVIKDNMQLIQEVNALRKELKDSRRRIRDLESITGLHKFISPKEAQKKLQMAVKTREDIYLEFENKLKEYEDKIDLLKNEVQRLSSEKSESPVANEITIEQE